METVNQTLTCISSKKLVVKSPSRFFRSDIDPDREIVVFVNDSTRVYVQNFNSGRVRQLSIAHKNDINCISVSKGFVATSGLDGKCTMLSLDGDQYVPVRRDNFQQAVDCALSAFWVPRLHLRRADALKLSILDETLTASYPV